MKVEARISGWERSGAIAGVRIEYPDGGISINNIYVRGDNGKPHITFPLSKEKRPCVYLRGELKQQVNAALWEAYCQGPGAEQAAEQREPAS